MYLENAKIKLLSTIFLSAIALFLLLVGVNDVTSLILFYSSTTLSVLLILRAYFSRNSILLVVFIFMSLYVFVTKNGLINNNVLSIYTDFNELKYLYKSTLLLYIFSIALYSTLKFSLPSRKVSNDLFLYYSNKIAFWTSFILCLVCIIFGRTGDTILNSVYGQGNSEHSSLFEYFFIPFTGMIIFKSNNKIYLYLIYFIALYFGVKSLFYGGRIEVFMLGISLIGWYSTKAIKPIYILVLSGLGIFFMKLMEGIRGGMGIFGTNIYKSNSEVIMSQEGDVTYASMRLLGMIDHGILTIENRIVACLEFVLSGVNLQTSELSNLSSYLSNTYRVGGGGLISTFFFVYGSYLGVVLVGMLIGKLFSHSNSFTKKLNFYNIYVYMILITTPRWYAYNPIFLIKLCIFGAIYITFLNKIKIRKL